MIFLRSLISRALRTRTILLLLGMIVKQPRCFLIEVFTRFITFSVSLVWYAGLSAFEMQCVEFLVCDTCNIKRLAKGWLL